MKYTVSLLYPKYAQDRESFPETYLAWVQAEDYREAIRVAQVQAVRANSGTNTGWKAADFLVLHVFEGHLQDRQYGIK